MKKILSILVVIALLSISCMSSRVVKLSDSVRSPVAWEMVTVYEFENQVQSSFEKLAVVTVKGSAIYNTKKGLLKALCQKAGQVGANAIILSSGSDKSLAYKAASVYFTGGIVGGREYSAVAVYVFPTEKK